jgi:hypothetical protein
MAIILDGDNGETLPGNLIFTGTGNRITGDFTNATVGNRVLFQTNVTNGTTGIYVFPNGTGTTSSVRIANSSDTTNTSICNFQATSDLFYINSSRLGTGTFLPFGISTNGTEQMRIATDGTITSALGGMQVRSGTAVASTSGTSIDFTGIPSWVKRITVMFNGVSTNGTSLPQVQLGDAGGIENTNYLGSASEVSTAIASALMSTGFLLQSGGSASSILNGSINISLFNANTWSAIGVIGRSNTASSTMISGVKTLSDTLDRIRITTVNGTDTFDAGSINILFE